MGVKEMLDKRKNGRSWEQVAKELGVSRMTLYNAINGCHTPSPKLLKKLGLQLKVVRARSAARKA